jgi:hypothetical protein
MGSAMSSPLALRVAMLLVRQIVVWMCALALAGIQAVGVPASGCVSGQQWGMCWRLPRNGYSVALIVRDDLWAVSGCVPGAVYHPRPYAAPDWNCTLDAP